MKIKEIKAELEANGTKSYGITGKMIKNMVGYEVQEIYRLWKEGKIKASFGRAYQDFSHIPDSKERPWNDPIFGLCAKGGVL